MAIQNTDVKVYKSLGMSDTAIINGGILSTNPSVSNIYGNIFPNVPDSERLEGSTTYRKMYWKNDNIENLNLYTSHVFLVQYTPGGDWVTFCKGTQRDVQDDLTGTERMYGAAPLRYNYSAQVQSIEVELEDSSLDIFQNADSIWITDNVNAERHDNITVSINDRIVTVYFDTGDMLANNYQTHDTVVSSMCPTGTIETSYDTPVVTSVSGYTNEASHPIVLDNRTTLEQDWILTFFNSSQFTCQGGTVGSTENGTIALDFAPVCVALSGAYFTIPKEFWSTGWQAGDTVTFGTHPSAVGIWFRRVVPAGTPSTINNFEHTLIATAVAEDVSSADREADFSSAYNSQYIPILF